MIGKKGKTYKHKILLLIKLALILALGHVIVKTVVIPQDGHIAIAADAAACRSEKAITAKLSLESGSKTRDYSAILKRDLFGSQDAAKSLAKSRPVQDPIEKASKSEDEELEIALIGTIAGSPELSRAIIKDLKTNVLSQYKTGDRIQTASIQKIEKDRVVLLYKGRRKVLEQRTKEFATSETNRRHSTEKLQTDESKKVEVKSTKKTSNTYADKLRHTAIMLPKANVETHSIDDEVDGLRISELDNIEGAKDLGLKDGDVIRAINGHRLNSKQKAFQIAMKARSQSALDIELVRDDEIRKFSLPLK